MTRRRILDAARRRFFEDGYAATTLQAVAAEAGVAVQTVYAVFGSKAAILAELRALVINLPEADAAGRAAMAEPTPELRLARFAQSIRNRWELAGDIVKVHQDAVRVDPSLRPGIAEADARRHAGIAAFVRAIEAELGVPIDVEHSIGVVNALTLYAVYEELVGVQGWTPDAYETWLAASLVCERHDTPNQHRGGRYAMSAPASITITPVHVADLHVEGEVMPVYVHVIDHPDARVLVDTGMTELHPAVADMDPRLSPLGEQAFDLAGIDIVVNTHLHFDHCGGNHLFAGRPIYVQRRELDDARSQDDYTIRDWVDAPGVRYVPVDGELELLPGLRLVPAPGHTPGSQVIVVGTDGHPVVIAGDAAVWFGELDEPQTEGQLLIRALDPELVWLAHAHEPWRPAPSRA